MKKRVDETIHSEDLQEIITKPPSWLMQRGISSVLLMIIILLGLSFFIRYPEVVNTTLKFNTVNAPKIVVARSNSQIVKLLVSNGDWVDADTHLAYMESIADHHQVLDILTRLKELRENIIDIDSMEQMITPYELNLGELQSSYHNFYLAYLNFASATQRGIFTKRRKLLLNEIDNITWY